MCKYLCCFKKRKSIHDYTIETTELSKNIEECGLCLSPLNTSKCIKTEFCNHLFHYKCYKEYVCYSYKNQKELNMIYCPLCMSNQYSLNICIV